MPANRLHPKKLLLSKWTASQPVAREKHWLVVQVIEPELPQGKIEWVDIEAIYSGRSMRIAWRSLQDIAVWRQGWI